MRTEESRQVLPPSGEAGTLAAGDRFDILRSNNFKRVPDSYQDVAATPPRSPMPSDQAQQHRLETPPQKRSKRFVPSSLRFLIALDVTLICLGQTLVLSDLRQRLSLNGGMQVAIVTSLSLIFTMGALYASGCYRRDSLVRFSTALSPLAVAIALAAAATIAVMHFILWPIFPTLEVYRSISRSLPSPCWPPPSPCRSAAPTAPSISPWCAGISLPAAC